MTDIEIIYLNIQLRTFNINKDLVYVLSYRHALNMSKYESPTEESRIGTRKRISLMYDSVTKPL